MPFYPYKENFLTYKDFKYRYLIGIYADAMTVEIYLPRGKVAKILIKPNYQFETVKTKIKYPIALDPKLVYQLYEIQERWIKKVKVRSYFKISHNHQA
jgi:hypothetical protein